MNKCYNIRFVFILFLVIFCANFSYSQQTISEQNVAEIHEDRNKEIVFEYKDTPEYIFIDRKNFMKNFSELQLEVLDTYDYPKFVSTNDKNQIELDIKLHWENVARWEEENAGNMEEILEALGLRK